MRPRWINHTTLKAGTLSILAAGLLMACEHGDRTPTASQPGGGIRGNLIGGTPGGTLQQTPEWLARALSLGALRSDDPRMTSWTDKEEPEPEERPFKVIPFEFDPFDTYLVRARWLRGIGCPTDAHVNDGTTQSDYSDPACLTGDSRDDKNKGLLLVKTGPTANYAAAGAELKNVEGIELVELGYDIRKPGLSANDPRGSHCGAGAPRFNVETTDGFWFIGCNSPPAVSSGGGASNAFLRLRWGPTVACPNGPMGYKDGVTLSCVTGEVTSLAIVFDEGSDTGPDQFGLAVLDNIDVNGTLVGKGPGN